MAENKRTHSKLSNSSIPEQSNKEVKSEALDLNISNISNDAFAES